MTSIARWAATRWYFLNDTIDGWYNEQLANGKTAAEINAYLSEFDIWGSL